MFIFSYVYFKCYIYDLYFVSKCANVDYLTSPRYSLKMTATESRPLLDKYMSLDQGERVQVLYVWIDGRLENLCVVKRRQ